MRWSMVSNNFCRQILHVVRRISTFYFHPISHIIESRIKNQVNRIGYFVPVLYTYCSFRFIINFDITKLIQFFYTPQSRDLSLKSKLHGKFHVVSLIANRQSLQRTSNRRLRLRLTTVLKKMKLGKSILNRNRKLEFIFKQSKQKKIIQNISQHRSTCRQVSCVFNL